jgi:hypothetical protein
MGLIGPCTSIRINDSISPPSHPIGPPNRCLMVINRLSRRRGLPGIFCWASKEAKGLAATWHTRVNICQIRPPWTPIEHSALAIASEDFCHRPYLRCHRLALPYPTPPPSPTALPCAALLCSATPPCSVPQPSLALLCSEPNPLSRRPNHN